MPLQSLEQRVAYLEGKTEEHGRMIVDVRADIRELRSEMIRRFEQVDARFNHVDTRFNWVLGLLFTIVLALVGAMLTLR